MLLVVLDGAQVAVGAPVAMRADGSGGVCSGFLPPPPPSWQFLQSCSGCCYLMVCGVPAALSRRAASCVADLHWWFLSPPLLFFISCLCQFIMRKQLVVTRSLLFFHCNDSVRKNACFSPVLSLNPQLLVQRDSGKHIFRQLKFSLGAVQASRTKRLHLFPEATCVTENCPPGHF